jgi:hypothetical protein
MMANAAETCRRLNKKEKLKVALKTLHFSVYEIICILTISERDFKGSDDGVSHLGQLDF